MIHSWHMDLFDQMPWVKTLFAWLVIATAVILFLSIPSYLILAPIARAVRDALNRFAAHLTDTHRANAAARKQLLAEAVDQYATDHLLIHLVTTAKTYWGRTMSDAMQTATQVRKAIQSAEQSVRELADSVPILEFRGPSADGYIIGYGLGDYNLRHVPGMPRRQTGNGATEAERPRRALGRSRCTVCEPRRG